MKKCFGCELDKPFTDFNKWSKAKDGLQSRCRECSQADARNRYKVNPERRRMIRKIDLLAKQNASLYVRKIKDMSKCTDCGEQDSVVLEFDHLRDKRHNVSDMRRKGFSINAIREEIGKCEVVCANCHRRRTAKRLTSPIVDAMIDTTDGLEV